MSAFQSTATNLVPGQTGVAPSSVFLRNLGTGATTLVSHLPGQPAAAPGGSHSTNPLLSEDGRYVDDAYISSFAGFVPAEDPRLVVVIVLERPQSKLLGTLTAMSAFRGIALDALRYARVPPDRP